MLPPEQVDPVLHRQQAQVLILQLRPRLPPLWPVLDAIADEGDDFLERGHPPLGECHASLRELRPRHLASLPLLPPSIRFPILRGLLLLLHVAVVLGLFYLWPSGIIKPVDTRLYILNGTVLTLSAFDFLSLPSQEASHCPLSSFDAL